MSWPAVPAEMVAPLTTSLLVIVVCYVIGCFNAGYYLVRWRRGTDIRLQGNGSTGATNVGSAIGTIGSILTLLLDGGKGALAVWLALHFRLGSWALLLSMFAVIVGHIWPAQLSFRGGKGVVPFLGAVLAADFFILFITAAIFVAALLLLRRFALGGLLALAMTAPVLACWEKPAGRAFGFLILVVPVLYAHRHDLRDYLIFTRASVSGKPAGAPSQEE